MSCSLLLSLFRLSLFRVLPAAPRHAQARGAIIGTLFGSLFMGLVNNGLILAGLDVAQQQVVRGAIIIAAVALSRKK